MKIKFRLFAILMSLILLICLFGAVGQIQMQSYSNKYYPANYYWSYQYFYPHYYPFYSSYYPYYPYYHPYYRGGVEMRPGEATAEWLFYHGIGEPWVGGDPPHSRWSH
ncbi:MAG: hypothetical protein LUQ38_02400 [Methanotrichaceae archaeon]|nr:hypothetical protein [Methanotrichaceae archaeon]MDD1758531.1 hypothetical protein [Methanotrichaceae archaeon]